MFVLTTESVSNVSNHSLVDVSVELNYIIGGVSIVSYIVLALVLVLYTKGNEAHLGPNINNGLIVSTGFLIMMANMPVQSGSFHDAYHLIVIVFFGTGVNIYGSQVFFKSPEETDANIFF